MKIRALIALLALSAATAAGAATKINTYDSFTLAYDDASIFGVPSISFGSSGNVVGFGWSLPTSVNVVSYGGGSVSNTFAVPDFVITANSGYSLSGLTASVGNLAFTEVGTATTGATASGIVSVNGASGVAFGGALTKTTTSSGGGYSSGYYSGSTAAVSGSFSTLAVTNGELILSATGGVFANISSNPQNEIRFGLIASAVPEPGSYAMFLAALGMIGLISRRGRPQA